MRPWRYEAGHGRLAGASGTAEYMSWSLTTRQFLGFALIGVAAFVVYSAVLYATPFTWAPN